MQQGNISLALLILIAALSMMAIFTAQAGLIRATNHAIALFDSREDSNLFCRISLEQLINQGPTQLRSTPGSNNAVTTLCLPARWDHAAPGLPRSNSSPIVCAIIHQIKRPNRKLTGILCD
jgi:hypothetical protein